MSNVVVFVCGGVITLFLMKVARGLRDWWRRRHEKANTELQILKRLELCEQEYARQGKALNAIEGDVSKLKKDRDMIVQTLVGTEPGTSGGGQ